MRKLHINRHLSEHPETMHPSSPFPVADTFLESFERILTHMEEKELQVNALGEALPDLDVLRERLDMTNEEVMLMAYYIEHGTYNSRNLSELAQFVGISNTRSLVYRDVLDGLIERGYLELSNGANDEREYCVPEAALEALRANKPYVKQYVKPKNTQELFLQLGDLFKARENHSFAFDKFLDKLDKLFDENIDMPFCAKFRSIWLARSCYSTPQFTVDGLTLLICLHMAVNEHDYNICFRDLGRYYDEAERGRWQMLRSAIMSGEHQLISSGYVEPVCDDGMEDKENYRLTRKALDDFIPDLNVSIGDETSLVNSMLVKPESIQDKRLHFDGELARHVDELGRLLEPERYQSVVAKLRERGFRAGVCALLYGPPGTGKTEVVLQLARRTGRKMVRVDVEKIKSCWVGESEKNTKALFKGYEQLVAHEQLTPILFFNEADAIFSRRFEHVNSAAGKMENAMQNILLQQMETLGGILIATTNLTSQFDPAFERRFLYKVQFQRPGLESRAAIWADAIPQLTAEESQELARRFNAMTGGQIENVARRLLLEDLLVENPPAAAEGDLLTRAARLAEQERIANDHTVKGFVG